MSNLNIVELIENNPISSLSDSYQNNLITKIKENFNDDEQHLFVSSFYCYLNCNENEFIVDLDNIWKWLGFNTKQNAKRTLQKNFKPEIDYKISLIQLDKRTNDTKGGQNKETIMLTIETFKMFCLTAGTEKAKQIHKYYIKLEKILHETIKEECNEFKEHIEQQKIMLENKDKILEETKKQNDKEREKELIKAYNDTPCVYLLKLPDENNNTENFIIKIGETDDIKTRLIDHRQHYKDCVLIEVFPCNRPHKFEQYLLNRPDIKIHRLPSTEIINITNEFTYKTLENIIKKNIDFFDNISFNQKLEYSKIKLQETKSLERLELLKIINSTEDKIIKKNLLEKFLQEPQNEVIGTPKNDEIDDTDNQIKSNRRVYKYNLNDLNTPISTYFSFCHAARSLDDPKIHDYHIRTACLNNTVQNNYRWYFIDLEDSNNEIKLPQQIPITKDNKIINTRNKGLVAQINKEKSKIINVYSSINVAAQNIGLSACSISLAIKNYKLSGGFYWKMYDDCSDELKSSFTEKLPEPFLSTTCSKHVQKIDPETNNVIETYNCLQDVCNIYKTCHKTIKKASDSGDIYKNFIWKIVI